MAKSVGRGVREKLCRANTHRETFEGMVQRFIDTGFYTVSREDYMKAGKRLWWVTFNKPIPQVDWSVFIGDSLFNFRSALDHLAFDLALAHTGRKRPLTDKEERNSEFPIFWRHAPKRSDLDRKIGAVHPEARKLIEAMQPYGRTDRAILGYLDRLHNLDKHRTLHLVAATPTGLAFSGDMVFDWLNLGTPLKDGDMLAVAPLDPKGDQNPHFSIDVAFSEPSVPSAAAVLGWIDTHICARVIPDLLPYL